MAETVTSPSRQLEYDYDEFWLLAKQHVAVGVLLTYMMQNIIKLNDLTVVHDEILPEAILEKRSLVTYFDE